MRTKHCLALLMFCVLLLAAGCGGSGKAGAPQGDAGGAKETARGLVDPCALLTKAEVEAALGEQVKEPEFKDSKNPLGQKAVLLFACIRESGEVYPVIRCAKRGHVEGPS